MCFYKLWPILQVKSELQNAIENSANFIENNSRLPIFLRTLYEEAFSVQLQ